MPPIGPKPSWSPSPGPPGRSPRDRRARHDRRAEAAGREPREGHRADARAHLVGDLLRDQLVLLRLVDPGERLRLLRLRVGGVQLRLGRPERCGDVGRLGDPHREVILRCDLLPQQVGVRRRERSGLLGRVDPALRRRGDRRIELRGCRAELLRHRRLERAVLADALRDAGQLRVRAARAGGDRGAGADEQRERRDGCAEDREGPSCPAHLMVSLSGIVLPDPQETARA